jgi:hypothetical protein
MTSIRIPRKPGMTDAEYDEAIRDAYRKHDQRLRNFHEFFITRGANRYVNEAVRNTLGNEEAAFLKQMSKIQRFQNDFINKLIVANPKIAREHSRRQRGGRFSPSKEYQAFMREANARSNTAVRKQFKNVLPAMNKYQARRKAFERDMQSKYAAIDPRYAKYLAEQRRREQASKQNAINRNKAYEKWAKQNDPSAYKVYMRDKKRYGNPANMVSNAFMNRQQNAAVTKSMQKFYAQNSNYSSPFLDKYRRLATPVKPKKQPATPNTIPIIRKPILTPAGNSFLSKSASTPAASNRSQQQTQALFDAQRAQFLRQQEAANKLKPIKTTTTTTSKPAKPVQPVVSSTPKQKPIIKIKSGGKVTKKYANGGSVRKPKYKG